MPWIDMTITIKTGVKTRFRRWLAARLMILAARLLDVGKIDFVWEGLEDD